MTTSRIVALVAMALAIGTVTGACSGEGSSAGPGPSTGTLSGYAFPSVTLAPSGPVVTGSTGGSPTGSAADPAGSASGGASTSTGPGRGGSGSGTAAVTSGGVPVTVPTPDLGETVHTGPWTTVITGSSTLVLPGPVKWGKLATALRIEVSLAPGLDVTGVDIAGAREAYIGFVTVGSDAMRNPDQDWRSRYVEYSVDPVLTLALAEVASYAKDGVASVGYSARAAQIVTASEQVVAMRVCVDSSGADVIDVATGRSVRAGGSPRLFQDVAIVKRGSKWFVADVVPDWDKTC